MVWLYVALGGFGLILLIAGILMLVFRNKKKERCTVKSVAKVVDVKVKQEKEDEPVVYCPVYEYEYEGKEYKADDDKEYKKMPKKGKKITIYINPEKPKEYFVKSFAKTMTSIVFIALGAILVVMSIVLYFTAGV
ncbi:MAG: DUF3592 domain-containing protein [Lachnospiraceae bacterium]|nr:DUF3592 domain-containing protein [Lachnospiraceae bacterium]